MIVFFIGLVIGGWVGVAVMACFSYNSYQRGKQDMVRELHRAIGCFPKKAWEAIPPATRQYWMDLIGRKDGKMD